MVALCPIDPAQRGAQMTGRIGLAMHQRVTSGAELQTALITPKIGEAFTAKASGSSVAAGSGAGPAPAA